MKKILISLLILSITTLWAEKYALIVGVNDVHGENALYTDIDLKIISKLLKKSGFKITQLRGRDASLKKVREKFKSFYSLRSKDTFLFYYTGHGARMQGVNSNEPVDNFFVMNSAFFSNEDTVAGGVLTDNEYSMHLHKIKAQKISIIDACHSATIYKSLSNKVFVKSIHPKGGKKIFNRARNILNFQSYKPKNLINISASKDSQQAENSPIGSIFTVALVDLIKKNPNISFRSLEKQLRKKIRPTALSIAQRVKSRYPSYAGLEGNFTPVITTLPRTLKHLLVKDIFVKQKPHPSLATVLIENPKHKLTIETSNHKKDYPLNRPIKLNIFSKIKEGYLYIFEQKQNSYTFLDQQELEDCQNIGARQRCKVDTIYATKPLGESVIYAVVTKAPLNINQKEVQKDKLIKQLKRDKIDGVSLKLNIR